MTVLLSDAFFVVFVVAVVVVVVVVVVAAAIGLLEKRSKWHLFAANQMGWIVVGRFWCCQLWTVRCKGNGTNKLTFSTLKEIFTTQYRQQPNQLLAPMPERERTRIGTNSSSFRFPSSGVAAVEIYAPSGAILDAIFLSYHRETPHIHRPAD